MTIDSCRIHTAKTILENIKQDHVLNFFGDLNDLQKENLLSQIEKIDWDNLAALIKTHVKNNSVGALPGNIEPAPWYPKNPGKENQGKYKQARQLGENLIKQGKVAAFTVAGGQGTRLGWDAPKGTFPATPVRGASLFEVFSEQLKNINQRYSINIPWYLMTSEANNKDTVNFFKENNYFGLNKEDVIIFTQGMLPAIDMQTGKVLLSAPDSLALSPDGHGGTLKALHISGALGDMKKRGVEQISYFQVDNPLVHCIDPLFIGLHAMDKAQMSSKMLPKREPKEKLGNFCLSDGNMTVIEYSDLPDELAFAENSDGSLKFRSGSIAIHVIRRDFVEKLNRDGNFQLPFHRAQKKIPYIDTKSGELIKPKQNNGIKLETFVFDALSMCENSIVLETDRVEEFAPIKNADSALGEEPEKDSGESSKLLQIKRAARWLEENGVQIPRDSQGAVDATIEISSKTAIYSEDLKNIELPKRIEKGAKVLL